MPKSNSNIHIRTPKNILKNRSDSFNSNNTISTITLRNGTEKRIRNKQTYRELYLERMSYIPIELPKNKGRNTSKKSSFAVSDEDYQILYSNKYPTIEASSFNTKLLKKELLNNVYKLNSNQENNNKENNNLEKKRINYLKRGSFEKGKNISLIKNNDDTYNLIDDKKDEENIKRLQNTLENVFKKVKNSQKFLNIKDENNETLRRERKLMNKKKNKDNNQNELNNSNENNLNVNSKKKRIKSKRIT